MDGQTPRPHASGLSRPLQRGLWVALALSLLAELLVALHPHFEIESVFGFHAWLGLLAGATVIGAAKALAWWLERPDSYYGERDD